MRKKLAVLLSAGLLAMSILSGCSGSKEESTTPTTTTQKTTANEETVPETSSETETPEGEELPDYCVGVYKSAISGGQYHAYMHFYPGGTYYFYAMTSTEAGFYTLLDEEITVTTAFNANDGGDDAEYEATCPQTLVLTDFQGKETARLGFDGDKVYGANVFGSARDLHHDEKGAPGDGTYDAENSICMYEYYLEGDTGSNVQIMHDGSYQDVMNYYIDGTWSLDGDTYTLESVDEGTFTLELSKDRKSAVYTTPDGESTDLILAEEAEKEVYLTLSGESKNADNSATITVYLYTDNTSLMVQDFGGYTADTNGTWKEESEGTISFSDESNGDFTITNESGAYSFEFEGYYGNCVISEEGAETGSEDGDNGDVLFTFASDSTTLAINADGTYTFTFASYGMEESGTWEYANYTLTLTQGNGTVIASTIDSATYAMTIEYVAEASDQLKDTYTAASEEWGVLQAQ